MTTHCEGYESEPLFDAQPNEAVTPRGFTVQGNRPVDDASERTVTVGEVLTIDLSALDVSPQADDIHVQWENGHVGPTYRVQPEDIGTTLRAVAVFASPHVEPLRVEVERAAVVPAPAPSIDRSLVSVASMDDSVAEVDEEPTQTLKDALLAAAAAGTPPTDASAFFAQTFPGARPSVDDATEEEVRGPAVRELVPVNVAVDAQAFSTPVDHVDVALVVNGIVMQRQENIARVRLDDIGGQVSLLAEDGSEVDMFHTTLTPPAGTSGSVAAVEISAGVRGGELGSTRVTVGVIRAGRTLALESERGVQFVEPRVGEKSRVKIRPEDFSPAADELSWQWLVDSRPVRGATKKTYRVRAKDRGKVLSAAVLARKEGHLQTLVEVNLGVVLPADAQEYYGPDLTIEGTPSIGHVLALTGFDAALFDKTPRSIDIQWLRDDRIIRGAHEWTYTITSADYGHDIWARVIAKRPGYRATILSAQTVYVS